MTARARESELGQNKPDEISMALDFSFSPEQNAWRAHVRAFAQRVLKPHSRAWDEAQTLPRGFELRPLGRQ